jgi:hypothetical protein
MNKDILKPLADMLLSIPVINMLIIPVMLTILEMI